MKIFLGSMVSAAVLIAGAAQGQALLPLRSDTPTVLRASDAGGPYAVPAYGPPPRAYEEPLPSRAYGVLRSGYGMAMLPLREVYAIVHEAGFSLLGMPQQRGPVYMVAAVDQNGEDGRLVIDARSGQIVRFMPAYGLRDGRRPEVFIRDEPAAGPELPQYRRPPFAAGAPVAPGPRLASRTPSASMPKKPPVRAVAAPVKPVAAAVAKPVAVAPAATPTAAAPVQQSAVTEPKVIEAKPAETPAAVVPPAAAKAETPPTVAAPATEAKPATPENGSDAPPPAQGPQ
jgi:hypothetical protein